MVRRRRLSSGAIASLTVTLLTATGWLAAFAKHQAAPPAVEQKRDAGSAGTPVSDPQDKAPSTVRQLEQQLFFKTYPHDDLATRLSRIEREVFGQPVDASTDARLAKLQTVLQQRLEAQKAQEAASAAATQAAPGGIEHPVIDTAGTKPASPPPPASRALSAQEEAAAAAQRARIAVQAAREEEINRLLTDGVDLYRAKRGMEAQQKFLQILRLDPTNAQGHFNLGIVKESMGNFVEALANYQAAAQEEPDNKDFSDAVTAVKEQAGKQRVAEDQKIELKKMAESANAAWKHGDFNSALDEYLQLDTREPNKALVKYNIGSIYLMLKDQTHALDYYKQAHKLAPEVAKYSTAYEELSEKLKKERKEREAVEKEAAREYKAAQTAPTNRPPMYQGPPVGARPPMRMLGAPAQQQGGMPPAMAMGMNGMPPQMNGGMPMQNNGFAPQQMRGGMPMQNNGFVPQQMNGGMPMQNNGFVPQQMNGGMPIQNNGFVPQQMNRGIPMQNNGFASQQMNAGMPLQSNQFPQQQMNTGMPMQSNQFPQQQMNTGMPMQSNQFPQQQMNTGMPMQSNQFPQQQMNTDMPMQSNQFPQQQMNTGMPMQSNQFPQQQMNTGMPIQSNVAVQTNAMPVQQPTIAQTPNPQQGYSPFAQIIQPSQTNPKRSKSRASYNLTNGTATQLGFRSTAPGAIPIGGTANMATFGLAARSSSKGVTVTRVASGSRAAAAGLQRGDDICAVDGNQVSSPNDVNEWLSKANSQQKIKVVIMRNGNLAVLEL